MVLSVITQIFLLASTLFSGKQPVCSWFMPVVDPLAIGVTICDHAQLRGNLVATFQKFSSPEPPNIKEIYIYICRREVNLRHLPCCDVLVFAL